MALQLLVDIDFTIVTEPQIRIFLHSNWLYSKQWVKHRQPLTSKAAVGVSIDILKKKCIWTPVCNLHSTQTLNRKAVSTAKEGPNATRGSMELRPFWARAYRLSRWVVGVEPELRTAGWRGPMTSYCTWTNMQTPHYSLEALFASEGCFLCLILFHSSPPGLS